MTASFGEDAAAVTVSETARFRSTRSRPRSASHARGRGVYLVVDRGRAGERCTSFVSRSRPPAHVVIKDKQDKIVRQGVQYG